MVGSHSTFPAMDCNREESIYHALSKWDTDSGKYVSAVEITVANARSAGLHTLTSDGSISYQLYVLVSFNEKPRDPSG